MTAQKNFRPLNVAVVTVSNRRTADDDESGDLIRDRLTNAGHGIAMSSIEPGDIGHLGKVLRTYIESNDVDVVITNGGTGIEDHVPEAVAPLLDREVPGFAAMFQTLSYEDIGSSGMLSRAMAGLARNTLMFCIPGSTDACRLAMDKLIIPQLDITTRPCALAGLLPESAQ